MRKGTVTLTDLIPICEYCGKQIVSGQLVRTFLKRSKQGDYTASECLQCYTKLKEVWSAIEVKATDSTCKSSE